MRWYDVFSHWYDASLEPLYAAQRRIAAEALQLEPDHVVLDLPTGTGQSLPLLAPHAKRVVAADLSAGMLRQAEARIAKAGWTNVETRRLDVLRLDERATYDRIHVFLGLSTFPDWERAFDNLWSALRPGGRMVVVDVHADPLSFQGRMVNLVARADIRRRTWAPLERVASDFARIQLPQDKRHGGEIFCATGTRPTT